MKTRSYISEILTRTNWSQDELARQLEVSHATLNSWANGKSEPRVKALAKIIALHAEVIGGRLHQKASQTSGIQIFFTTPYSGKTTHQATIDAILDTIREQGRVITPENTPEYSLSVHDLQKQGLNRNQAHYAFIRQGIASSDVVIIEASHEDIRVGHELTLALLFHKPTLVLARAKNFAHYITHDLLTGAAYDTTEQASEITRDFLQHAMTGRAEASMQTLSNAADNLHSSALATLRRLAKQEPGQFGQWARSAETQPAKVAKEIEATLGSIQKRPAWSVFAPIYNEDSPDYIQHGVASFVDSLLARHGLNKRSSIVEAAAGTGALSRQLAACGYRDIAMFDNSREMLAEAFRLSATTPQIKPFEADIYDLKLSRPAHAIIWTDYSSNFALNSGQLTDMLTQLLKNLVAGGLLIFDIRTYAGWQIDFYSQPITTFATERFQRVWLNHQDRAANLIDFDVYIRTRDADGAWAAWQRESMRERMWHLHEVHDIVANLPSIKLHAIYGDDFRKLQATDEEPGLAYLVIEKLA